MSVRWSDQDNAWVTGPLTPADDPLHPGVRVGSRPWVHVLLFALTFLTMTWAGAGFFLNYVTALGMRRVPLPPFTLLLGGWLVVPPWPALLGGLWFSVPALLILTAHEFGHYFACRYYRIPASLPYFIPMPFGLIGTLGAVIRMALPRTRKALLDVGIAGPIAGFVVLLPFAIYGISHSYVVRLPRPIAVPGLVELGDPLLVKLLQTVFFGTLPAHSVYVMHPTGFAAWFGLIATALNLFPAGQLDGGHIVHALVGRASRYVTIAAVLAMVLLAVFVSSSWALWATLIVLMTYAFGLDHPPVDEEHLPIGNARVALGLFAIVMFVLSFTPVLMSPIDFIGRR